MRNEIISMRISWICLVVVSLGILGFGLVEAVAPVGADSQLYRADGLASAGLGLFGGLVAFLPFRRRERWAWGVLWFYPLFWVIHLVAQLPPGKDHIHQVVFIVLSLAGLVLPIREFFPAPVGRSGFRKWRRIRFSYRSSSRRSGGLPPYQSRYRPGPERL